MRNADYTHTFDSFEELKEWIAKRRDDKKAHYYYGFWENFDGNLYTIRDIEKDMDETWFCEESEPCEIYEWELESV